MKRLFIILSVLVSILLPSVLLVGCGDKYKNMSLEVQFYECKLDENGNVKGEWVSVDTKKESEGYGLNFVLSDMYKENEADTYFSLKCRVLVNGTKKNIGQIAVSVSGTGVAQLNTSSVKKEEEFVLKVFDSGSVTLTFVPSIKSEKKTVEFPVNLYRELSSISATADYKPAVVAGGQLMLNELTDLIDYEAMKIEGKGAGETNQRGVSFSIDGCEMNENGEYILKGGKTGELVLAKLETKNNINRLTVNKEFLTKGESDDAKISNYGVIKLKATSVYSYKTSKNEEISCDVFVVAVKNVNEFYLNYERVGQDPNASLSEIELFEYEGYNSSKLILSGVCGNDNGITFKDKSFDDVGNLHYSVSIYVDGKKVNDSPEAWNGIQVEEFDVGTGNLQKGYTITASKYNQTSTNEIEFVVDFDGALKFTNEYKLTKKISVKRTTLPTNMIINGEVKEDGASVAYNIFTDYEDGKRGLAIKIGSSRITQIDIGLYTDSECTTYDNAYRGMTLWSAFSLSSNTNPGGGLGYILNESGTVYFKFNEGDNKTCPANVYVKLTMQKTPERFEGVEVTDKEYVSVLINLRSIGALKNVGLTSDDAGKEDDLFKQTEQPITLEAGVTQMYLSLTSNGSVAVDKQSVSIKSKDNKIKFSADGTNFYDSITCDKLIGNMLYFKGDAKSSDKIVISSENGFEVRSKTVKFVNIVTGELTLHNSSTALFEAGKSSDYYDSKQGYYYALQRSKSVDFYFQDGNSKSLGIYAVDVITCAKSSLDEMGKSIKFYGSATVSYSKFANGFSVTGVVANETTVLKMTVSYYAKEVGAFEVETRTKVVYFEIAVYSPIESVEISADKSEIYYINEIISETASVNISITPDKNASTNIYFSDDDINKTLNHSSEGVTGNIFGIKVEKEGLGVTETGLNDRWLDLTTGVYGLKINSSVESTTYISLRFVVIGLCSDFENYTSKGCAYIQSYYKTIKVVTAKKSTGVKVEGTFKGNVYLSLNGTKSVSFSATIVPNSASYKELEYRLYEFDVTASTNGYKGDEIVPDNFTVSMTSENRVKIDLLEGASHGGKYVLSLVSLDSYSGGEYGVSSYVIINISDGTTANPYYLSTIDDFKNIANAPSAHYALASDINLSGLTGQICETFSGSIDGMVAVYDPNNNVISHTQYKLTNLTIGNAFVVSQDDGKYYGGLFGKNTGEINNLVLEYTRINLSILNGSVADLFIGALAGENTGKIVNSSIGLIGSSVEISADETTNSNYSSYNIGGIVGHNGGEIRFYDEDNAELKKYSICDRLIENYTKFEVTVTSLQQNAYLNLGGVVGKNDGLIKGNYFDYNDQRTFNDYLTSKVNLHLEVKSAGVGKLDFANVGGVAGENTSEISCISITGKVEISGSKGNLGGFVGNNTADIKNTTSYSLDVLATTAGSSVIVGGVAGKSNGRLEDAYVLMLDLTNINIAYINKGEIFGGNVTGGIIGENGGGTIKNANVQSFISQTDISGNTVGGLVGNFVSGSAELCYVKANLSGVNIYSLDNDTNKLTNAYFVGQMTCTDEVNGSITVNTSANVYAFDNKNGVLYFTTDYYYESENELDKWFTDDARTEAVADNKPITSINANWNCDNYLDYNYRLPVLMKDGETTMFALPTEMITQVRPQVFGGTDKDVSVSDADGYYLAKDNVYTAIIKLSDKEYDFIGDEGEALISKSVLPIFASKEYGYKVKDGAEKFSLKNNKIVFKQAGRIEIEFFSLFSSAVSDTVIFYVEENFDNLTILKGENEVSHLNLYTGEVISLTPNVLFGGAISGLNTSKLYFTLDEFDDDLIEVSSLIGKVGDKYSFGEINLNTKKAGDVTLAFKVYLNLKEYTFNDGKTLFDIYGEDIELFTYNISIKINPSATSLKVNTSDKTVATGETVLIEVEMETGFKNSDDTSDAYFENFNTIGDYLTITDSTRDTIKVLIETDEWVRTDLEAKGIVVNSLWDLFDYKIKYVLNNGETGYIYTLEVVLKEEYRDVFELDRQFNFKIYANSNDAIYDSFTLNLEPQELTSLRIDNYKCGGAYYEGTQTVIEYTSSDIPSSIIEPGKSGLLKIYVEPNYARVDEIVISSEPIQVNGKTYKIRFEQMIFDRTYDNGTGAYVNYAMGAMNDEDNSLKLSKVSFKEETGELRYTGVIFVRTILASQGEIYGLEETFNIKISAKVFDRDSAGNVLETVKTEKTVTKLLKSQYKPGLTLSVENGFEIENQENSYVVGKNSQNVKISAKIWGYDRNSTQNVSLAWVDNAVSDKITDQISYEASSAILQTDGSYLITYTIKLNNLAHAFKFNISVGILAEGGILDTETKELSFYPTDYLPSSVYLKGSASDILRVGVNSSKTLEFVWLSSDGSALNSAELNEKLVAFDNDAKSKVFSTKSYNASGAEDSSGIEFGNNNSHYKLNKVSNLYYSLEALGEYYQTIYVEIHFKYELNGGKYELVFTDDEDDATLEYSFAIDIRVETSEEDPDPIYTADAFLSALTDGANLILMNDIELENWTPITAKIASLDGNNKRIKIKSFRISTSSTEILGGLFATISEDTIVKNLTIDLGSYVGNDDNTVYLADENAKTANTYFGFLAGINEGNVYNCEVITTETANKTITISTSSNISYIGGLVGENRGNITNSRFGTPYFLKLAVDANGAVSETTAETKVVTIEGSGIMGGLVGFNNSSAIISSSYFYNANLVNVNTKTMDEYNKTAGLVAVNASGGKVLNSYVKGTGITQENPRGTGTRIESTKAGSVAGFVFENSGTIENCYSNILVKSSAGGVAGFVYRNNSGAVISKAYSASKVVSDVDTTDVSFTTQLPFVGVGIDGGDHNRLLSDGELNNCFYLKLSGEEFSTKYDYSGDQLAYPLDSTNIANSENLTNFAFVNGDSEQEIQGIWTYFQTIDKYNSTAVNLGRTILPELTSANQISRSIREIKKSNSSDERYTYIYGLGYELGSSNNPYIIRDSEEYNTIFSVSTTHANVLTGHFRLISDISFHSDENESTIAINSSKGYILGDSKNHNITVFDGNGMTISEVNIKNTDNKDYSSVGMFSEIYYSIVKNLNVEYSSSMEYTSTKAIYSGGLAGKIKDSFVIELTISGQNSQISAQNFAGGVAGIVLGDSGLFNISVDINVKTGYAEASGYNQYLSESAFIENATRLGFSLTSYSEYLKKLSYAGGVAGVIDINSDATDFTGKTNVMKVTVGKNGAQVVGDIAGYVAGYLGRGVKAVRLKSVVSEGSYVSGSYIAGGLVGENYAYIEFSQVASEDDLQDEYDDNFAKYILLANSDALNNDSGNYGNLSFVQGYSQIASCVNYAGGFVGVNLGGVIKNSYTKGSINANSRNVGGFAGATVGGGYDAVYAENYINLTETDNSNTRYVGGFSALNIVRSFEGVSKIYSLMGYNLQTDSKLIIDNIVASNFYDKEQLTNIETLRTEENAWSKNLKVTNFIAKSGNAISSNEDEGISVNIYYLSYDNLSNHINSRIVKNEIYSISSDALADSKNSITLDSKPAEELYDLEHENQSNTFDTLFTNFDEEIWDKQGSAHEHYMPKLTEKNAINYYEIRTENDLLLIELHPDADFKLIGDIVLTYPRANHVIFNTFTGTLTGELREDGSMPSISGIKIYTTDEYSTAGFFKKTDGASISGINFVYDYMVICNNLGKDYVGLLSSEDSDSGFVSVSVSVNTNYITEGSNIEIDGVTTISNSTIENTYDATQIFTVGSNVVNTFGGLLGKSLRTKLESCNVKADCKLSSSDDTTVDSYWGGLVGDAKGSGANKIDYILKNSSYKGNAYLSNFTYVGGTIGQGENVNASYLTAEFNEADNDKISLVSSKTMYVGGIFGTQKNSYSNSNKVIATINKVSGTGLFYIGGASGSISNMDVDRSSDVEGFSGKFVLNIKLDSGVAIADDKKTLVYGGLAGLVSQNVKITNSVAWTLGSAEFNTIYLGGSIGRVADTTQLVYLDNVFNYLEGDKEASGVEITASNIYAGGFYGDIASNNAVISTNNSHTTGAIWACSGASPSGDRALVMGGLVGSWGKSGQNLILDSEQTIYNFDGTVKETYSTNFNNVYTTVALESSQYTVGEVEYEVNALFGRLVGENVERGNLPKIKVNNLYYSSDYNLAVEERDMFDGLVKNLLSGAILEVDQKRQYFENLGWTIDEYGLPYRTNLVEAMKKLPSTEYGTLAGKFGYSASGGSLRPIMINSEQITNYEFTAGIDDVYKYYFISKTNVDSLASENRAINLYGELKGFLLGGGALIMDYKPSELATLTSNTILETMTEHSVISNLQIQLNSTLKLQSTLGNGGIVTTNNGTIFYCFVDYYSQTEAIFSGGGIAGTNNGNILYSYNTGTLDKVSSSGAKGFGGICNENAGFIYSSGFVGGFSSTGGGICVNNTTNGTIKNCYSAGVLNTNGAFSTFVKENGGTIRNSYYDKYANAEFDDLKSEDATEIYIKALVTSELQLNYASHLTGSWRTYRMERSEDANGSSFSDYYNYGYPVYHLEQSYFDASIDVNQEKTYFRKGLFTGNGSGDNPYLISNIGTLESINTFTKTSGVNYKLINDIDFNKNKKNGATDTGICGNWTGISKITIKVTDAGEEREMTTEAFAGIFNGGTRGAGIWIKSEHLAQGLTEINRKIANLTGESGLFNETGDGANISNLTICGAELGGGKTSLGALINEVNGSTTLSQIHFSGNSGSSNSELSISATHVGGIIGSIAEGKTVNISYVNKAKDAKAGAGKVGASVSLYTLVNTSNMGLIVGANNGDLTIEQVDIMSGSKIGLKEKSSYSATNVGGLVGQNSDTGKLTVTTSNVSNVSVGAESVVGSIVGATAGNVILHISCKIGVDGDVKLGTFNKTGSHMGGVVGNIQAGGALNVETTAIDGVSTEQSLKVIVSLGGFEEQDDFAGQYVGGIAGSSVANISGQGKVEVTLNMVKASSYAGGAVGHLDGGTVSGLVITLAVVGSGGTSGSYATKGFGGVVGYLEEGNIGKVNQVNAVAEPSGGTSDAENGITVKGNIEFNATPQLGGAVACMDTGSITNLDLTELEAIKAGTSEDVNAIMASGEKGIGGIIGVVKSAISLGSVTMNQTEISADNKYENIGGLIGYLMTDSISKMSDSDELNIEGLTVKGVVNVGGFVGQYAPQVESEGETVLKLSETLSNLVGAKEGSADKTGFAEVQLVPDESGNGNNVLAGEVVARNIGGLFGYFNAKGTLGYTLSDDVNSEPEGAGGEESGIESFANYNKVLYYTQTDETESGLSAYASKNKRIENVGGIAGLALTQNIQGTNEIDIGSSSEPKNYSALLYENAKELKIYRMRNVGGLVGNLGLTDSSATDIKISSVKIGSQSISGYENVGGVVGYINVQNHKIEYGNIDTGATVGGFKQVGGLVGYSDGILLLEDTDELEMTIEVEVYGRTNVGGLFGYMTSSNTSNESKIRNITLKKAKVYGLTNVGGMAGQIKNVNTLISATDETGTQNTDKKLTVEVKGNTNVGGIVGLFLHDAVNVVVEVGEGQTETQTIMTQSTIQDFNVTNLKVYTGSYKYGKDKSRDNEDAYYLSTSVGGLVGYADNLTIDNCEIRGKIAYRKLGEGSSPKIEQHASSVGNYMLRQGDGEMDKDNIADDFRTYESIGTGIGGFVGTFNPKISNENTITVGLKNSQTLVDINVENGINVGGLMGYCYVPKDLDEDSFGAQHIGGTVTDADGNDEVVPISIVGAMGVGGVFGYLNGGSVEIDVFDETITFNEVHIQQVKTTETDPITNEEVITYESKHGEYVGGFAGRSTSLTAITIENDAETEGLIIDNTRGGYFGGVIGWLEGSLLAISQAGQVVNESRYSSVPDNIFKNKDKHNYGGMVGLLSVTGNNHKVYGYHTFDFTVDTVLLNNLDLENVKVGVDEGEENIVLSGIARLSGCVDIAVSAKPTEELTTNPLFDESEKTGWAYDYTMFRTVELGGTSDKEKVRETVYDASCIQTVGASSDKKQVVYTVTDVNGESLMYTRFGIARFYQSSNSETALLDSFKKGEANRLAGKEIAEEGTSSDDLAKKLGVKEYTLVNLSNFLTVPDENIKSQFGNFRSEKVYTNPPIITEDGTEKTSWKKALNKNFTLSLYYIMHNSPSGEKQLFKIETIYAKFNGYYYYDTGLPFGTDPGWANGDKTTAGEHATITWTMADSGSLFDASGYVSGRVPTEYDLSGVTDSRIGKAIFKTIIGLAAVVVLGVALAKHAWIVSICATVVCVLSIVDNPIDSVTIEGIAALFSLIGSLFQQQATHSQSAQKYMTTIYEGNYGVISQVYSRPWVFTGSEMATVVDDMVYINVDVTHSDKTIETKSVPFLYYSKTRPTDVDDTVKVEEDCDLSFSSVELSFSAGDTMYKYEYYNGKYYVNMVATEITYNYNTPQITERDTFDHTIIERDGFTYVAPGLKTSDGTLISYDSTKSVTLTLHFAYDPEYEPSTNHEKGYDYIEVNGTEFNWKLSNKQLNIESEDIGMYFEYYLYEYKIQGVTANPNAVSVGYKPIENGANVNIRGPFYAYATTNTNVTPGEVNIEPGNGETLIYSGADLYNKNSGLFFTGNTYCLKYTASSIGITQDATYYLASGNYFKSMIENKDTGKTNKDYDMTEANKIYPLEALEEIDKQQVLYTRSGEGKTIKTLGIGSQEALCGYFVIDVSSISDATLLKYYNASNFYKYQGGSLYKYNKSYVIDTVGNTPILAQMAYYAKGSDLEEGKSKVKLGSKYVYTHYPYKNVDISELQNFEKEGLNPLTNPDSFSDYYFTEVVMVDMSGRKYDKNGAYQGEGGGIRGVIITGKTMTTTPKYTGTN